jgi:hypothetical protein
VLERAALHQTRFRTPGVAPDSRGVTLGQQGVVLFPSIDRLVAFLRAYGNEGSLDDLITHLKIRRLITPLRTREIMLSVAAESSYRMDRIAGIAKLAGGLVFTGTARHFVKYRDSASPLGYDVLELLDEAADMVLYHDSFQQSYSFEREIPLRDLIFKLTPYRVPHGDRQTSTRLWASAEVGVGAAILTYLFRWQVTARAALAEWPPESAFDDQGKRLYLFDMSDAPERIVKLLDSLPGVHVFEPLGKSVAVEFGYEHPIALDSCTSLFDDDTLHLFRGDGDVLQLNPLPPFAPVRSLVRTPIDLDAASPTRTFQGSDQSMTLGLDLKLAPTSDSWRNVTATVIPIAEREWLARLLYALPPATLASLRMGVSEEAIYVLDPGGIEGLPLGVFQSEVAPRIYVPSGLTLVPAVAPAVLEELVRDRGTGYVFFSGENATPIVVPREAFGPVSRRALRNVSAREIGARAIDMDEPLLPLLRYDAPRRFPLWGLPKEPKGAKEE